MSNDVYGSIGLVGLVTAGNLWFLHGQVQKIKRQERLTRNLVWNALRILERGLQRSINLPPGEACLPSEDRDTLQKIRAELQS